MRFYHFPKWLRWKYPNAIWDFFLQPTSSNAIYLTFDDGPNPETTPWLLDLLDKYDAKATFFCLGKNVTENPQLFQQLIAKGHGIGNHTHNHLPGWQIDKKTYVENVEKAAIHIDSRLFRPPYGRIKTKQLKALNALGYTTVFWSHLSYDFDKRLTSTTRLKRLKKASRPGAIIVFHDAEKAFEQLKQELPQLLDFLNGKGMKFHAIQQPN